MLAAAATLAASVEVPDALAAQAGAAARPAAATFFTRAELALVDELSEMIIPTDDHSPGARAAKVAGYIDARLAEAFEETDRSNWRQGLKLIEDLSTQAGGRGFLESSPEQRLALLQRIAGRMAAAYRDQIQAPGLTERLPKLAAVFSARQIPFEVTTSAGQLPVLTALACPYPDLAEQDRSVCAMERLFFSELLGQRVTLENCRLDGQACCTFQFHPTAEAVAAEV